MAITRSCCCGAVHIPFDGTPDLTGICHCSRCRKLGASNMAFVALGQFEILAGEEAIQTLKPLARFTYRRSFCSWGGTSPGEPLSPDDGAHSNAHCVDQDPGLHNAPHECLADAPAWSELPETACVAAP